ncbi:AAA family ATPase [Priestia koreensis]|uniref:AAA family ATPase n=1 Tax=Priestia koreensis TaxID=284581 RepID=UPI00203CA327|nr:AAA family ATPase [Priestia koreensis]MCM3003662.1 ATP-binding protein [Priestia koreensis]
MFIKQIQVEQFKKLTNFKLKFPESEIWDLENNKEMKLSVIIGENGTAKTTIFQLIINSFVNLYKNTEIGNYKVEYLLNGKEYIKTNDDDYIEHPLNIVVSSYTPIDKLDIPNTKKVEDKILNHNIFLRKTNTNAYGTKELTTHILRKYLTKKFEEVYSILGYIGFEKREIHFECAKNITLPSNSLRKIVGQLSVMKDEEYKFDFIDLNSTIKDKVGYYSRKLDEFSRRLGVRSRSNFFKRRINNTLYENFKPQRGNISFKGEHYVLEAAFILEKLVILSRMGRGLNSNYKTITSGLLSITDINYYPDGNIQLLQDLNFLNFFSVHVFNDVWFENNFNNELVPLSMLSSGELSMFIRFFELHEYVKDNSVVLIDEPETHLHPKWIRGYIKTLINLLGDKKCHVILATHSPLIISDVTKNCIIGLKKEGYDVKQVEINDKTLGLNYDDVLSEIFDLADQKGTMIHEYVDIIDKLLEFKDFDKALKIYSQIADSKVKYELFLKLKAFRELEGEKDV